MIVIAGIAVVAVGVHVVAYDPFADPGCTQTCADLTPILGDLIGTRAAMTITTAAIIAIAVIGGLAVAATLRIRSSRLVGGAALGALAAVGSLAVVRRLTFEDITPSTIRLPLEPLAVAAVGAAVCLLHLRVLRTRAAVDKVVTGLSTESVLRGAVVDVQFAVPGENRWLDPAGGAVVEPPEPGRAVVLTDGSEPAVRLIVGRTVDPAADPRGSVPGHPAGASQRTVVNGRSGAACGGTGLPAPGRRHLGRRASPDRAGPARRRSAAAGRRRSPVAHRPGRRRPGARARIEKAEHKVGDALSQLRRLAHGIFPAMLADEGLEQALTEARGSVRRTGEAHDGMLRGFGPGGGDGCLRDRRCRGRSVEEPLLPRSVGSTSARSRSR